MSIFGEGIGHKILLTHNRLSTYSATPLGTGT